MYVAPLPTSDIPAVPFNVGTGPKSTVSEGIPYSSPCVNLDTLKSYIGVFKYPDVARTWNSGARTTSQVPGSASLLIRVYILTSMAGVAPTLGRVRYNAISILSLRRLTAGTTIELRNISSGHLQQLQELGL